MQSRQIDYTLEYVALLIFPNVIVTRLFVYKISATKIYYTIEYAGLIKFPNVIVPRV